MNNKQKGVTLIELLVAMLILLLIMGALVSLFGTSVMGKQLGEKQQIAYSEARWALNELKTTLRYADPATIAPQTPTETTASLNYYCTVYPTPLDLTQETKMYKMEIGWKDSYKKQINIKKTNVTAPSNPIVEYDKYFPSDANVAIGVFGGVFPIVCTNSTNDIYQIDLPVQYESSQAGTKKVEHFMTSVRPLE